MLLTCIALALAMPLASGASHADPSASLVAVRRSSEAPRLVRSRSVLKRPHSQPSADAVREPARAKILPNARFAARRTFLINCALLC